MGEELTELMGRRRAIEVICADCEDRIGYEEEFVLLQVVQPQNVGGRVFFYPIMDELGLVSDYQFEPYQFCFKCWEDLYEKVKEEMENTPPDEDVLSVIECTCCGSGIREWEITGLWTVGEFITSKRAPAPEFTPGPRFDPASKPEVLCTYCLALLNEVVITMWDDFPTEGTCLDCVQLRCWRVKGCACSCHEEGESE
jgi:hypothetical protein